MNIKKLIGTLLAIALLSSNLAFAMPVDDPELVALQQLHEATENSQGHEALDAVVEYFASTGIEVPQEIEQLSRKLIDYNETVEHSKISFEKYLEASTYGYIEDEWNNLTEAEKELALNHPVELTEVALARRVAYDSSVDYWGYHGSGDAADAYRHMMWNGLMTIYLDSATRAKVWADAHEDKGGAYLTQMFTCGFNGNAHTHMDLFNNQLGRDVAVKVKKGSLLHNEFIKLINAGKVYTIHPHYDCMPI